MKNVWRYLAVVTIALVLGCSRSAHNEPEFVGPAVGDVLLDTNVVNFNLPIRLKTTVTSDSTALLAFSIDGKEYTIDTLIAPTALGYIEVLDFDGDGSSEILLDYMGNNPTYFLYLYDSGQRAFRPIEDYMSFPESRHVAGERDVYYSYCARGCADMNWDSELFEIHDFQIRHLGHLYGIGCELDSQKISIYRVIDNNSDSTVLVETLPFSSEDIGKKWEIDEAYWNKNYLKFMNRR